MALNLSISQLLKEKTDKVRELADGMVTRPPRPGSRREPMAALLRFQEAARRETAREVAASLTERVGRKRDHELY